jgi:DNA-binding transcriptional regulator YbjK
MVLHRYMSFAAFIGLLLLLVGCAVPKYDELADKAVAELQNKIDQQFYKWASLLRQQRRPNLNPVDVKRLTDELAFSNNLSFYAQTYADLDALRTRLLSAETEQKSLDAIDGWFNYLTEVVRNTETEHQEGKLSAAVLELRVHEINGTMRSVSTYILVTKTTSK